MNGAIRLKRLVWLVDEIQAPPFSARALDRALYLLRAVARGEAIPAKRIRSMPSVARGCAELKIRDGEARKSWRIMYRDDPETLVIAAVFEKMSQKTPRHVIDAVRVRLKRYDEGRKHGR